MSGRQSSGITNSAGIVAAVVVGILVGSPLQLTAARGWSSVTDTGDDPGSRAMRAPVSGDPPARSGRPRAATPSLSRVVLDECVDDVLCFGTWGCPRATTARRARECAEISCSPLPRRLVQFIILAVNSSMVTLLLGSPNWGAADLLRPRSESQVAGHCTT